MSLILGTIQSGSSHRIETHTVNRRTAGGDLHQVSEWTPVDIYDFIFGNLSRIQVDDLKTFFCNNIGLQVLLADEDGNQWRGIVVSPEIKINRLSISRDQSSRPGCSITDDGLFTMSFKFEGTLL